MRPALRLRRLTPVLGAVLVSFTMAIADEAPSAEPGPHSEPQQTVAEATPEDRFRQAGVAYEAGRYEQARELYRSLLADGHDDGRVHYNLGNVEFKRGEIGRAILGWERALARLPADADARENLSYARGMIADKLGEEEEDLPGRLLRRLEHHWSAARALGLLAALSLIASALAAPLWFETPPAVRRVLKALAAGALALAFVAGLIALSVIMQPGRAPQAVILSPSLDARSAPSAEGTVLFTVHEGLKVAVHEERAGWVRIGIPNGLTGWIDSSGAERI